MNPRALLGVSGAALVALLVLLSTPLGPISAIGPLLGPTTGLFAPPDEPRNTTLSLPGLSAPVTVVRDSWGVPHIFASSDTDAAAALGFVQAQDRLFQMVVQKHLAEGRLSELLGKDTVELDRFIRAVGLGRAAQASLDDISAEEGRLLEAYTRGVNGYISRLDDRSLPTELKFIGHRPEPWRPLDTLAVGKLFAYFLAADFSDLQFAELERAFGPERVWGDLFLLGNNLTLPVIPDGAWSATGSPGVVSAPPRTSSASAPARAGSNNWAVGPGRSATGAPLLAGDPHLQLQLPPVWYEAHVVVPGFNQYGISAPGLPAILIGFNDRIAWSMTNVGGDVMDLYEYEWDAQGRYLFRGEWRAPRTRAETLKVKGGADIPLTLRETVHGPLVEKSNRTVAVRWSCSRPTHEGLAILRVNRARNHSEFLEGIRHWQCPPLNFVYGDREGNIAMWVAGTFPVRKGHDGYTLTNGSALAGEDWAGFIPFESQPHVLNPPQGYLASANQMSARNYTYCLDNGTCESMGWDLSDGYRSRRINEMLRNGTHTLDTMARLQFDRIAIDGREIAALLVAAYDANPGARTSEMERAVAHLRGWSGDMGPDLVAPTLYTRFLKAYRNLTWADDYAAAGLAPGHLMPNIERLEHLTKFDPSSRWFDLAWTPRREARDDILLLALRESLEALRKEFGPDMATWTWGRAHPLVLNHLSGIRGLSRGPYALGGWFFTVSPVSLERELPVHRENDLLPLPEDAPQTENLASGASWRMVVDLADPSRSLVVLPGGQSSDFSGPHYDDQLKLWLKGEYHPVAFGTKPEEIPRPEVRTVLAP
ncbi:MAG: penicillin acylase family protein [Halobacteria archaeon]